MLIEKRVLDQSLQTYPNIVKNIQNLTISIEIKQIENPFYQAIQAIKEYVEQSPATTYTLEEIKKVLIERGILDQSLQACCDMVKAAQNLNIAIEIKQTENSLHQAIKEYVDQFPKSAYTVKEVYDALLKKGIVGYSQQGYYKIAKHMKNLGIFIQNPLHQAISHILKEIGKETATVQEVLDALEKMGMMCTYHEVYYAMNKLGTPIQKKINTLRQAIPHILQEMGKEAATVQEMLDALQKLGIACKYHEVYYAMVNLGTPIQKKADPLLQAIPHILQEMGKERATIQEMLDALKKMGIMCSYNKVYITMKKLGVHQKENSPGQAPEPL